MVGESRFVLSASGVPSRTLVAEDVALFYCAVVVPAMPPVVRFDVKKSPRIQAAA